MTRLTQKTVWIIFIIIAIVLVGRLRFSLIHTLRAPSAVLNSLPIAVKNLINYNSLRTENEKLKTTIDFLTNQLAAAKEALDENERLHSLLAFKKASPYELIAARVAGRSASLTESAMLIDKGLSDGIKQDMPVVSPSGLIGRIAIAGKDISWVIILTDTDFRASCITARAREAGLLQGQGGARCIMKYLAQDSDIISGDEIITSGFGGIFPKGIRVGKILKVYEQKNQLYKSALIKPAADLRHLEEVFVIVNSK